MSLERERVVVWLSPLRAAMVYIPARDSYLDTQARRAVDRRTSCISKHDARSTPLHVPAPLPPPTSTSTYNVPKQRTWQTS